MKKHIIILTSYYPPIISVASNRIYSFTKYLDKNNFEISVIFPFNGNVVNYDIYIRVFPIKNSSLFKYYSFDKNTYFFLHKLRALWNRFLMFLNVPNTGDFSKKAYKKIEELIKPSEDTIIISSSPHIENHLIAKKVKENFTSVKWIADLRDALSNNPYIPHNQINKYYKVENIILSYADAITTVSKPILEDLQLKNKRNIPIIEIRNGFDFESCLKHSFNEQFTLVYAGTFYANRTPETFFKALISFIKEQSIIKFKIVFAGNTSGVKIPHELENFIIKYDKMPYNEVIKIIQNADALLMIQPPTTYKGVYTGKLFDYLGAMKPIIAIVDKNDVAAQLIKECNAGFIADFYNIEEIKTAIAEAYKLWQNRQTLNYNQYLILMHHRSYQVKILEHLIEQLYNEQ